MTVVVSVADRIIVSSPFPSGALLHFLSDIWTAHGPRIFLIMDVIHQKACITVGPDPITRIS